MQVVACSPFTKLFLPEWEDALLENPDLVMDETKPFFFNVPRATGAIENVQYGVPFRADDYLQGRGDGKDAINVLNYLSGGHDGTGAPETDWTGIVQIKNPVGFEQAMREVQSVILQAQVSGDQKRMAEAEHEMKRIMDQGFKHTQATMKASRADADARVIRQLKNTHNNLMKQYKRNVEDGKGTYEPSVQEHLGLVVLDKIIKINKGRREMAQKFHELIKQIQA